MVTKIISHISPTPWHSVPQAVDIFFEQEIVMEPEGLRNSLILIYYIFD
jgi:hypothetical protein